jgi:hypothetical protein
VVTDILVRSAHWFLVSQPLVSGSISPAATFFIGGSARDVRVFSMLFIFFTAGLVEFSGVL